MINRAIHYKSRKDGILLSSMYTVEVHIIEERPSLIKFMGVDDDV